MSDPIEYLTFITEKKLEEVETNERERGLLFVVAADYNSKGVQQQQQQHQQCVVVHRGHLSLSLHCSAHTF